MPKERVCATNAALPDIGFLLDQAHLVHDFIEILDALAIVHPSKAPIGTLYSLYRPIVFGMLEDLERLEKAEIQLSNGNAGAV